MNNLKDKQINIRLSKKEREKINYLAKEYGFDSVSEYVVKSSLGSLDKFNASKKIVTLTLNPAVDYIIRTDNELDEITNFMPEEKYFEPGGKGINASIIIDQFNGRTLAIHYSGGFTGELLSDSLNELNIQQLQIPASDTTRINLKLNFSDTSYEVNSTAVPLSSAAKNKILRTVSALEKDEILMVMGSYHANDESFIIEISDICTKNGVEIVYDISKPLLKDLLKYKPLIIKPNKEELEMITGSKIETKEQIINNMFELQKMGAKNVAVTMGGDGAYLLDEQGNLFNATVDPIKLVSPQGSGDSFLSTFVVKREEDSEEAFRWANAAGAATAQIHGLADFQLIENNLKRIHITKLDK